MNDFKFRENILTKFFNSTFGKNSKQRAVCLFSPQSLWKLNRDQKETKNFSHSLPRLK